MRYIKESELKSGRLIKSFEGYVNFINESQFDPSDIKKKVNRAMLWLSINKGFYGELISHLNIYGSYDLKPSTITTNGYSIIFHPDFIMSQSDEAIRFALAHEILHCIGDHSGRRENRDKNLWNVACDYSINPMLKDESGMQPPVDMSGEKAFLYSDEFVGMRPEEIYEKLEKKGASSRDIKFADTGMVWDDEEYLPPSSDELIIYDKGDSDFDRDLEDQEDIETEVEEPGEPSDTEPGEEEPGQTGEPGEPGEGEPGEGEPGEGQPGEGEPGEGQPGEGQPGEGQPGEGEPGEPGEGQPGEGQPGEGQPGEGQPGEEQPGEGQPGEGQPGEEQPGEGQPGEPGEGEPGIPGEPGDEDGKKKGELPKVGQKIITLDGKEGIVKNVYPNGDIEI